MDDNLQASSAVANAEACIARGHYNDAVKCLTVFPRNFVAGHIKCIDLLSSITFKSTQESHILEFFNYLRKIRGRLNSSAEPDKTLEAIAEVILKNLRIVLEEAAAHVKEALNHPTERDVEFAIITGVPMEMRVKDRSFLTLVQIINKLAVEIFFGHSSLMATSKNILHCYCMTALQFIAICVEYELDKTLDRVAESIFRTLQKILLETTPYKGQRLGVNEKETQQNFLANPSAGEEMITMLSYLADQLTVRGCWRHLWSIVLLTHKVSQLFDSLSVHRLAYESIAKTFFTCKLWDFHAYYLSRAAGIDPEKHATHAVIAALCTRDYEKEYNPFETNPSGMNGRAAIASALNEPETDTAALLARLLVPRIATYMDPVVLKLVQELHHPAESTNYHSVKSYVQTIFESSNPVYQPLLQYKDMVHEALLHREVEQVSQRHNRVDLNKQLTMIKSSTLTDKEYVEFVEPAILQDVGIVSVDIDCKNRCVTFQHSAKKKLHHCFNTLGSMVAVRLPPPTVERKDHLGVTHILPATLPSISMSDLRAEAERSRAFFMLQDECIHNKEERMKRRIEKNLEEKKKIKEHTIQKEKEKQEKLLKARRAEEAVQQKENNRKAALRKVLHILSMKYPGVKFDELLTSKSTTAFEDEVTMILADFKRQKAESSQKESLAHNLLERTLRRLEIPKLKEFHKRNEELHKEERAAARQNFLQQHRTEYDKRMAERVVLRKFQKDAEVFERDVISQTLKEKSSKRDEQQLLLEQEMRRMANQ